MTQGTAVAERYAGRTVKNVGRVVRTLLCLRGKLKSNPDDQVDDKFKRRDIGKVLAKR